MDFIIDNMTWSFSRLESFHTCKYMWKKQYIDCEDGEQNAFASYGTLGHKLLEQYAKGELDTFDLAGEYESRFDEAVPEEFPPNKFVDMRESYYNKGLAYFESIGDRLGEYKILGVEKKVEFELYGKPFVGYIDLLLEKDGEIYCVDHKSANIQFKKNGEPNKSSSEKMQTYKYQLYMYSKALIDAGIKVDYLVWNFFNNQHIYKIPWKQEEYEETLRWVKDTLDAIDAEEGWEPNCDFYFCHYICNYRGSCEHVEWKPREDGDVEWETG